MSGDSIDFDGSCPFLTCLDVGPHDHPICDDCGAVRYGNITCATCRRHIIDDKGARP